MAAWDCVRADDQAGIERLMQCMIRCSFSLARLIKVSKDGTGLYKTEKHACRAFPLLADDGMKARGMNCPFHPTSKACRTQVYLILLTFTG